jgi:hypothetical protein
MNILDALANPDLLGRSFKRKLLRADTWHNWRAFLCALFGLPFEDAAALKVYQQCTGRVDPPTKPFREAFIVAGRRSGKSFVIAATACFVAAFLSFAEFLSPGEVPAVVVIASDKQQAQILLKYIRAFFASSKVLKSMLVSDLKEVLTLSNGVEVSVQTGDFRSIRGRTIVCALLDELAFFASDGSAASDVELLNALRPSQATIPTSLLLGISSPYGRRGVLYNEHREHFGKNSAPTLIWQAASEVMNPTISKATIQSAYLRDPISAACEWGGLFRNDLESFISREAVEACVVGARFELPYVKGRNYRPFCDPSGGRGDSFTLAIAHAEGNITVLDFLGERPAPFDPEQSVAVFAEILKRYHCTTVTGDAYSGEWCASSFARHGIEYVHSDKNRSELYLNFLPQIMSRQTQLLDDARLVSQLCSLERKTGRNADIVDHPAGPNYHDDVANVAAGALGLVAANNEVYGLLDFAREFRDGIRAQWLRAPEGKRINPRDLNVEKAKQFEFERRLLGIDAATMNPNTREAFDLPATPPCANRGLKDEQGRPVKCIGKNQRIGGGGLRCAQCGYQDFEGKPPRVVYGSRGYGGFGGFVERDAKRPNR